MAETPALRHQSHHSLIGSTHALTCPRQVIPYQQVRQILSGKIGQFSLTMPPQRLVHIIETLIRRVWLHHRYMIAAKTTIEHTQAITGGTGKYAGARGTVTLNQHPSGDRFSFRILLP